MPLNKFGLELNHQRRQKGFLPEFRIRQMIERIINTKNFLVINQSNEYDVDMKKIVNLSDPKSENDGVNKRYVDALIASKSSQINSYNKKLLDDALNKDFSKFLSLNKEGTSFNAQLKKIVNVDFPLAETDAANKRYVDRMFIEANQNARNGLTGIVSEAIKNSSSENKQYVDQIFKKRVDFHKNRLINVGTPYEVNDAATKKYVDDKISVIQNSSSSLGKSLSLNEKGNYDAQLKKIEKVDNPLHDDDATNKRYVDHLFSEAGKMGKETTNLIVAEVLRKTSEEHKQYVDQFFKNRIDFHKQRITNLGEPHYPDDAATKMYVDNATASLSSILQLELEAPVEEEFFTVQPWNVKSYNFHTNVQLQVFRFTGQPKDLNIQVVVNFSGEMVMNDIMQSFTERRFYNVPFGTNLRFLRKNKKSKNVFHPNETEIQFIELLVRPY